jgi:hypothetical protein
MANLFPIQTLPAWPTIAGSSISQMRPRDTGQERVQNSHGERQGKEAIFMASFCLGFNISTLCGNQVCDQVGRGRGLTFAPKLA